MKKTEEKKSKGVIKLILTLLINIIILVTAVLGKGEKDRISINVQINKLIDKSNVINVTNIEAPAEDNVSKLIDELNKRNKIIEEKEKELSEKNDEITKLKDENESLKASNASSETTVGRDTDTTTDNSDDGMKAITDGQLVDLIEPNDTYSEVHTVDDNKEGFKIAGEDYYSGITIGDTESSYVLVRLHKKYTRMSFDVGRVDESAIKDGKLLIIGDKNTPEKYNLDGEKSSMSVTVDVTGIDTLKIRIDPNWSVYGIVNIKLK